jgi:hypothetical protein
MHAINGPSKHDVLTIHRRLLDPTEPTPTQGGAVDLAIALHRLWLHHIATPHAKGLVSDVHVDVVHPTESPQLAFSSALRVGGCLFQAAEPFFVASPDDTPATLHALQRRAVALLAAVLAGDQIVDMDARHVHHSFPMEHNGRVLGTARFAWDNTEPPACLAITRFLYKFA